MEKSSLISLLINPTLKKCREYIRSGIDGLSYFVDPNDKVEISAHYGVTHAAAAFIIYGKEFDHGVYEEGVDLLHSVLQRWEKNVTLPAFHYDFNNFALCIAYDYIDDNILKNSIRKTVCDTPDSNHDTVNWLPMRWYVNEKRYSWTSDNKYLEICKIIRKKISSATNEDGSIEDRLPKGISFNLQYDISTVATLSLLRTQGININLSTQLGFLLKAVMPDGDINYQGRGCNQIFAWGPWLYLLSCTGRKNDFDIALRYLTDDKLDKMLSNDNLMLNGYTGKSKYLWWDYHYASVYIAHLLFWSVLAFRDFGKGEIMPDISKSFVSGFNILNKHNLIVSWFDGRKEYLAEKGPTITSIYIANGRTIFKGTFGPWQGLFGNNNTYEDVVLKNFIGLLGVTRNVDFSKSRILRRLFKQEKSTCKFEPIFLPMVVECSQNAVEIRWESDKPIEAVFNIPVCTSELSFEGLADGQHIDIVCIGQLNNQYGERFLFQSHSVRASSWILRIILS